MCHPSSKKTLNKMLTFLINILSQFSYERFNMKCLKHQKCPRVYRHLLPSLKPTRTHFLSRWYFLIAPYFSIKHGYFLESAPWCVVARQPVGAQLETGSMWNELKTKIVQQNNFYSRVPESTHTFLQSLKSTRTHFFFLADIFNSAIFVLDLVTWCVIVQSETWKLCGSMWNELKTKIVFLFTVESSFIVVTSVIWH